MIVLAYKDSSFVQAANDEVGIEKALRAAPALKLHEVAAMANAGAEQYLEPSAAAHVAAMALWQEAPVTAPA